QSRSCVFDWGLDASPEVSARQRRRQWLKKLDDDRSRISPRAPSRPKEAGVERQRHRHDAKRLVERHIAGFVVRRRAWHRSRPFRKDHDLAPDADALL